MEKCYQSAADQEHPRAQYNLGVMYENGQGVEKNLQKAAELYQKAADQGDPNSQCNLGFMYSNGQGVEKNLQKAAELYQKAADQGLEVAKNNLKDKSLQIATPFGLHIANITLSEIKAKYKIRKKEINNSPYAKIVNCGEML